MKKVLKTLKALAALGGTALAVVGGISIYHKFFKKEEDLEDAFDDEELFEEEGEEEDDTDKFAEEEIFEEDEPAPVSDTDEASVKETEPEEIVSSEDAEEDQKDA